MAAETIGRFADYAQWEDWMEEQEEKTQNKPERTANSANTANTASSASKEALLPRSSRVCLHEQRVEKSDAAWPPHTPAWSILRLQPTPQPSNKRSKNWMRRSTRTTHSTRAGQKLTGKAG